MSDFIQIGVFIIPKSNIGNIEIDGKVLKIMYLNPIVTGQDKKSTGFTVTFTTKDAAENEFFRLTKELTE